MQQLVSKAEEDFQLVVTTRIAEHKEIEDDTAEQLRTDTLAAEQARVAASAVIATAATVPAPAVSAAPVTRSIVASRPTVAASQAAPDLRLGQIGERLGFTVTAEFLRSLGYEAAGRDRAAVLYHDSDFDGMCVALVGHINNIRTHQREAA